MIGSSVERFFHHGVELVPGIRVAGEAARCYPTLVNWPSGPRVTPLGSPLELEDVELEEPELIASASAAPWSPSLTA
jgi:hypothetical protein